MEGLGSAPPQGLLHSLRADRRLQRQERELPRAFAWASGAPSFSVGKVVGVFAERPCQHVGVRGVGSREQKNADEGLRVLPQDENLNGSGEDLLIDERKNRGRRLRRSRFSLAGRVVPESISNTDGRGVGGRYPGWRGFARVEFSSALLQ